MHPMSRPPTPTITLVLGTRNRKKGREMIQLLRPPWEPNPRLDRLTIATLDDFPDPRISPDVRRAQRPGQAPAQPSLARLRPAPARARSAHRQWRVRHPVKASKHERPADGPGGVRADRGATGPSGFRTGGTGPRS